MDEPTLENTFVATLRDLGQEVHSDELSRRAIVMRSMRGQVAIGADAICAKSSGRSRRCRM